MNKVPPGTVWGGEGRRGEGGGYGGELKGRWEWWCGVECGRSSVTLREFFNISIYCHFIVSVVTALNQSQTIQNLHN